MAPKIDSTSNAYLTQRYDELYNASADFKSRLHNVVTSSRALKLVLDPGAGHADYGSDNSITVCRQRSLGVNKTDTEVRDDIFFELHNAKKSTAFSILDGSSGYNIASLTNDSRKAAGYALAVEWTEWVNVAESTILVYIVNSQAGTAGPLLTSPPEYRSQFDAGDTSWLKFSNYLDTQVATGHTSYYDDKASNGSRWTGYDILRVTTSNGRNSSDVTIVTNEIAPTTGQPKINSRGNPFTWDLVKVLDLH